MRASFSSASDNKPFGSRPEPWTWRPSSIHKPLHGEVPEGPAGAHLQSTCPCAGAHSEAGAGTGRYGLSLPVRSFNSAPT